MDPDLAPTLPPSLPGLAQDEMIEMQEREEQAGVDEKLAIEKAGHNELMKAANLDGVDTLSEDMVRAGGGGGALGRGRGG